MGLDEGDSHKIVQNRASKISMEDFNWPRELENDPALHLEHAVDPVQNAEAVKILSSLQVKQMNIWAFISALNVHKTTFWMHMFSSPLKPENVPEVQSKQ